MENGVAKFEDGEVIGGLHTPDMFDNDPMDGPMNLAARIKSAKFTNGKFGPNLEVEFRLEDGELVRGWFPCGLIQGRTTKSRYGEFVVSMFGSWRKFEVSELVGRPCMVEVEYGDGPEGWPKLRKVRPFGGGGK